MEAENMVHSGLNVPSLPRNLGEVLLEVGVEDLPDGGLGQTFLTDPHNTFEVCQGVPVPCAPVDTLMLEHGVRYGQAETSTEVQYQNTTQVQIEAIPPNHALQVSLSRAHMSVEVPQYNNGVPGRGGELTGRRAHITVSDLAWLGPMGKDPATRPRLQAPTPGLAPGWGPRNEMWLHRSCLQFLAFQRSED
ncbi:hypothetical protein L3Q82_003034 [Scortum barcoo]|uniref:Uncharacterized protein n=1 Tax=Scortum barcoo TaxID=214431 RepID=A0ACB8VSZ1_9TELE|nr:hypothetical protein L3Q82_003034 [Scortum barcoo]